MNIVDIVLVLLLVLAAFSGYRQGLVTALLTLIGAVGGAMLGIRLAPLLIDQVPDSAAKIAIAIALMVAGVGLGELLGSWLGSLITRRLRWRPVRAVDRGLGLVGQAIAVLAVAWLIALPLAAAPVPWLSSQIRTSAVLGGVDRVMPPAAQDVSARLRTVFVGPDFPAILAPLAPAPNTPVERPDPGLGHNAAALGARESIVKVRALAPACSQAMEGTGFVIAPGVVVTNAHVVAGASTVRIDTGTGRLATSVMAFDPEVDLAVLAVPDLTAPPLSIATEPAASGDSAVAAGYPLDGPFTLSPMRVRSKIMLTGPDITGEHTVTREVYTLRGQVRPGNSGGPLLAPDGTVLGVIFGAAIDNPNVGFALTADEIRPVIAASRTGPVPVATGACLVH